MDEALAAFGLVAEEPIEPEATECYPDNWQPLQLFRTLGTQWRVTDHGAVTGLHYEVVPGVMDMLGIKKKHRADLFYALREMESEALTVFNRKR